MSNLLVYDVDPETQRRFKAYCALKGISMSAAIREFMTMSAETLAAIDVPMVAISPNLKIEARRGK